MGNFNNNTHIYMKVFDVLYTCFRDYLPVVLEPNIKEVLYSKVNCTQEVQKTKISK